MQILRTSGNKILRNAAGQVLRAREHSSVHFGLLYNPFVLFDARNIIAPGWRHANVSDISAMRVFSGNAATLGTKCKEVGSWGTEVNTNEFQLNLRPSGWRNPGGTFASYDAMHLIKWNADTWRFGYFAAGYNQPALPTDWIAFNSTYGFSVRPVKISTSLTHGQSGLYQGYNGKVYRTICIGGKEWLADNLAETLFATGEAIPEITGNAAWAAATGPALCALNNNWNNV